MREASTKLSLTIERWHQFTWFLQQADLKLGLFNLAIFYVDFTGFNPGPDVKSVIFLAGDLIQKRFRHDLKTYHYFVEISPKW